MDEELQSARSKLDRIHNSNTWIARLTQLVIKILAAPKIVPQVTNSKVINKYELETTIKSIIIAKSSKNQPMVQQSKLQNLLQDFVNGTSDVQGAALVSPDGLPLTSILSSDMDEERTAAMSAAMLSLGERICQELVRGEVERLFVEGKQGYSILVGCGEEVVLLVLASKTAKQGLLFLDIRRLVGQVKELLST